MLLNDIKYCRFDVVARKNFRGLENVFLLKRCLHAVSLASSPKFLIGCVVASLEDYPKITKTDDKALVISEVDDRVICHSSGIRTFLETLSTCAVATDVFFWLIFINPLRCRGHDSSGLSTTCYQWLFCRLDDNYLSPLYCPILWVSFSTFHW